MNQKAQREVSPANLLTVQILFHALLVERSYFLPMKSWAESFPQIWLGGEGEKWLFQTVELRERFLESEEEFYRLLGGSKYLRR